jgi:hypothetical protein
VIVELAVFGASHSKGSEKYCRGSGAMGEDPTLIKNWSAKTETDAEGNTANSRFGKPSMRTMRARQQYIVAAVEAAWDTHLPALCTMSF